MARYPQPGRVKTRLARSLGARRAADLYHAFLLDIDARFAAGRRTLVWVYEPADAPFAELLPAGRRCLPQHGAGLGERMRSCFESLLAPDQDGGFDRVIMIGADVPHVRDACLDEADAKLGSNDVILGPSDDGGYYLVALRRPADLFTMIEMGTPRVLEQTLAAVVAAGLRAHLLPVDFDVDDIDDLERLRRELGGSDRPSLPHTVAALGGGAASRRPG